MVVDIGALAGWLGAAAVVGAFLFGAFRLLMRLEKLEKQMAHRKEDVEHILKALLACLDGLHQQGANGNVTKQLAELDAYMIESR